MLDVPWLREDSAHARLLHIRPPACPHCPPFTDKTHGRLLSISLVRSSPRLVPYDTALVRVDWSGLPGSLLLPQKADHEHGEGPPSTPKAVNQSGALPAGDSGWRTTHTPGVAQVAGDDRWTAASRPANGGARRPIFRQEPGPRAFVHIRACSRGARYTGRQLFRYLPVNWTVAHLATRFVLPGQGPPP